MSKSHLKSKKLYGASRAGEIVTALTIASLLVILVGIATGRQLVKGPIKLPGRAQTTTGITCLGSGTPPQGDCVAYIDPATFSVKPASGPRPNQYVFSGDLCFEKEASIPSSGAGYKIEIFAGGERLGFRQNIITVPSQAKCGKRGIKFSSIVKNYPGTCPDVSIVATLTKHRNPVQWSTYSYSGDDICTRAPTNTPTPSPTPIQAPTATPTLGVGGKGCNEVCLPDADRCGSGLICSGAGSPIATWVCRNRLCEEKADCVCDSAPKTTPTPTLTPTPVSTTLLKLSGTIDIAGNSFDINRLEAKYAKKTGNVWTEIKKVSVAKRGTSSPFTLEDTLEPDTLYAVYVRAYDEHDNEIKPQSARCPSLVQNGRNQPNPQTIRVGRAEELVCLMNPLEFENTDRARFSINARGIVSGRVTIRGDVNPPNKLTLSVCDAQTVPPIGADCTNTYGSAEFTALGSYNYSIDNVPQGRHAVIIWMPPEYKLDLQNCPEVGQMNVCVIHDTPIRNLNFTVTIPTPTNTPTPTLTLSPTPTTAVTFTNLTAKVKVNSSGQYYDRVKLFLCEDTNVANVERNCREVREFLGNTLTSASKEFTHTFTNLQRGKEYGLTAQVLRITRDKTRKTDFGQVVTDSRRSGICPGAPNILCLATFGQTEEAELVVNIPSDWPGDAKPILKTSVTGTITVVNPDNIQIPDQLLDVLFIHSTEGCTAAVVDNYDDPDDHGTIHRPSGVHQGTFEYTFNNFSERCKLTAGEKVYVNAQAVIHNNKRYMDPAYSGEGTPPLTHGRLVTVPATENFTITIPSEPTKPAPEPPLLAQTLLAKFDVANNNSIKTVDTIEIKICDESGKCRTETQRVNIAPGQSQSVDHLLQQIQEDKRYTLGCTIIYSDGTKKSCGVDKTVEGGKPVKFDLEIDAAGDVDAAAFTSLDVMDSDGDGTITSLDYARMIQVYGQCRKNVLYDNNFDGCVNALDASNVIDRFGETIESS